MNEQMKGSEKQPETQEAAGELARSRCRESQVQGRPRVVQQAWVEWAMTERRGKERRQEGQK